jgi:hypothetical protein
MHSWSFVCASQHVLIASCFSTGTTLLSSWPCLLPQRQVYSITVRAVYVYPVFQLLDIMKYFNKTLYLKLLPLDSTSESYFLLRATSNIDMAIVPACKVGALYRVGLWNCVCYRFTRMCNFLLTFFIRVELKVTIWQSCEKCYWAFVLAVITNKPMHIG